MVVENNLKNPKIVKMLVIFTLVNPCFTIQKKDGPVVIKLSMTGMNLLRFQLVLLVNIMNWILMLTYNHKMLSENLIQSQTHKKHWIKNKIK
jgi:hypothetical protein